MSFIPSGRRGTTLVRLSADDYMPQDILLLTRLGRELRLLDQICDYTLTLDKLTIEQSGPAPAWTTLEGDQVSFSMADMPMPRTRVDVAVWLGTNAHELIHVNRSPRRDSPLMQRITEGDRLYLP